MGADEFWVIAEGKTAADAFRTAVKEAQYEHGHGGYTGTIAEKRTFKVIPVPAETVPTEFARKVGDDTWNGKDPYGYGDKWGPALCVKVSESSFLFFGLASC